MLIEDLIPEIWTIMSCEAELNLHKKSLYPNGAQQMDLLQRFQRPVNESVFYAIENFYNDCG